MLNYPLNKTMGSCLESSFSCLVGNEEKDAAAKIDLDKQRAEAWGLWDSGLRGVCGDWFLNCEPLTPPMLDKRLRMRP